MSKEDKRDFLGCIMIPFIMVLTMLFSSILYKKSPYLHKIFDDGYAFAMFVAFTIIAIIVLISVIKYIYDKRWEIKRTNRKTIIRKIIRVINYTLIVVSVLFCMFDYFDVSGMAFFLSCLMSGFVAVCIYEIQITHGHAYSDLDEELKKKYYKYKPDDIFGYLPEENENDFLFESMKQKANIKDTLWTVLCMLFPVFSYSMAVFLQKTVSFQGEEDMEEFIFLNGDKWYIYLLIAFLISVNWLCFRYLHLGKSVRMSGDVRCLKDNVEKLEKDLKRAKYKIEKLEECKDKN